MRKILVVILLTSVTFSGSQVVFAGRRMYPQPPQVNTSTEFLGSNRVHVRHEDLIDIPPLPNHRALYASYEGSGKMTYLFGRGSNSAFGVEIWVDGREVARSNAYNLTILGNGASLGWKLLRPDAFEVNNQYTFSEKLQIYLFNHSTTPIKGGAHVELEVY